mgnify:FL=1
MQWRYIGNTAFSNTIADWLDAVYTLGTSSTYYDGSTRTPGSGQAATFSRYQNSGTTEAVFATPATDTLGVRYIWAGKASSASPTMATPDSFATDSALISLNKNSGAFNAWDNSSPFTSGQFFGYWRAGWRTSNGAGTLYMFESETANYLITAVGTDTKHNCVGAWLKPGSTANTDAETDGKLYGVYTSGNNSIDSFWSDSKVSSASVWFGHSSSSTRHHTGIFSPGGATIKPVLMNTAFQFRSTDSQTFTLPSGRFAVLADSLPVIKASTPKNFVGVLDSMAPFGIAQTGQVLADTAASKDIGYVVSERIGSASECALLLRNEP